MDQDRSHIQGDIPPGLEGSPLINRDLAPIPPAGRTWGAYHFAALWMGMCASVPTYLLARHFLSRGMSPVQAILAIFLGSALALVPILLNSLAGTRYGIPFPVFARSAFGVRGSNVVGLARGLVACGVFAVQTWAAAQSITLLLSALIPSWSVFPANSWIAFVALIGLSLYFLLAGMESVRFLLAWGAPFLLACGLALLVWIRNQSPGFGPLMSREGHLPGESSFFLLLVQGLSMTCGAWAALALNISDFTRFARSGRDAVVGQVLGLPPVMALFSLIGLGIASATIVLFGRVMWNPVELLSHANSPVVVTLAIFFVLIATLATNLALHLVGAANAFSNLWPRGISFRTGGLLAGALAFLIQPWRLLADPRRAFITGLAWYSALLGPAVGILIADYFIVRRGRLVVPELYRPGGAYWGRGGINYAGLLSLLLGIALALVGVYVDSLRILFDYAWFTGFLAGLAFYPLASAILPSREPAAAASGGRR